MLTSGRHQISDLRLLHQFTTGPLRLAEDVLFVVEFSGISGPHDVRSVPQPILELAGVHSPVGESELAVAMVGALDKVALVLAAILVLVDAEAVEVTILELPAVEHEPVLLRDAPDSVWYVVLDAPFE